MKKAKRLLAVLLAALMLFTAAYVPSYAYIADDNWHTAKDNSSQKYYFDYAQGASWVLDFLDDMLVGLGICLNCDELNDLVNIGINIFTSNILLNTDKYLEDAGALDETGQGALDLRSVDMLIKSLYGFLDCLHNNWVAGAADLIGVLGDLVDTSKGLQMTGLDPTKLRYAGVCSDKEVLEMLITWISNQKGMLASIVAGTFSWGSLLEGIIGDLLNDMLSPVTVSFTDHKADIGKLLKDVLYNMLIDSTAASAPTDGSTVDDWVQHLIDMMVITGTGDGTQTDTTLTHAVYGDGGFSMLGANAEPLMPAVADQPGAASITSISVYQFVSNIIQGLFGGTLKDMLYDLLADMLDVQVTDEFPMGDPAILNDPTYSMIIGVVQGLFEDNGAPKLTLTGDAAEYPVPQMNALLDWLLVGDPANNVNSALDTFILIDYYGFHIQDNFMSLLNDVARLLINLLPSLGLFADSAHLAYEPEELTVIWFVDENYNLVSSLEETAVTQTYVTFETNEVVYPTEFVTDANGAQTPSAYCYLDDKSAVNTTDSTAADYMNPALIRPNYVITTDMVYANIIKLAINDFIEGCYFPEWTTDIPSVLAYGFAAMAAPVVPENNYYERLDAYHAMLEGEVTPIDNVITTVDGDEVEILHYSVSKVITIKDANGNATGTANVQIPKAALDIISSFGAKRLNGVFHFKTDTDKFTTDTTFEQFLGEFLIWAANQYMPAFIGSSSKNSDGTTTFVGTNTLSTNDPIFAAPMTTLVNAVYSDYTAKTVKETANWDVVYDFVDSSLFKLLPTSWLPHINGSSQLINQWLLENLVNFNLQGILNLFQVNEDSGAELNNSVVKVIINVLDRVLALVFNDNGVMITSGQTSGRQGVVMNNSVTTLSSLAGLLDCSSTSASLPMLISNLLDLLNRYKTPLLCTILPIVLGGTYIRSYTEDGFFPNGQTDLKKYKIATLEDYLSELRDNKNAIAIKTFDNIEDAEAALERGEDKPMAVKNADGVQTDIILSTGTIYGTYSSRDEANTVLKQLQNAYIEEIPVDEENEVYSYTIWTRESYLTSATGTLTSDAAGEYTDYTDFRFSHLTYRTTDNPFVSYDDDYYFFEYEDFGTKGFYYNNRKDAYTSGDEFISSYYSFAESDLVDAYGEWYMFYIESELRKADLFDKNGDGKSVKSDTDGDYVAATTDADGNVTDPGFPVDGDPGIPDAMYPYYTSTANTFTYYDIDAGTTQAARTKTGFFDSESGQGITDYTTASFNSTDFEQLAIALEYASDPANNVVLSDEDAESVVRLALGTIDFDITLNGDGVYTGATQWEDLTEAQLTTLNTWVANNGFTFTTETAEDGTTVYKLARPAFAIFSDGLYFGDSTVTDSYASSTPNLDAYTVMGYSKKGITGGQTYAEEIQIAMHTGYYEYIETLYDNRVRLLDEIDELSWRIENAEDGRKSTADTTVLKWLLDLTENDYKNKQTRKRNVTYIQDEKGNNVESKAFTTTSYLAFRDAYDYALCIYDEATDADILALGITQSMITSAYQGLLNAWMNLVEFTGFADWTQIDSYVAIAEAILSDPYINHEEFGIESGLTELVTALKDAYVYTDNADNPDTSYDLNKSSKGSYDSEYQNDIDSAAALLNQAIQNLVYKKIPTVGQNPEGDQVVKIQDVKYENLIQTAHIYGLEEGVGFGDGTLDAEGVLELLNLKVSGMTVDGSNYIISRTNSARGSGTDAKLDGRYRDSLRFRYFAILYGDINGDTRIDNTDASALRIYIEKKENDASIMGEAKFEAADVTHDGGVDVEDVQAIINHYSLVKDAMINQEDHSPVATYTATFVVDGEVYKTNEVVYDSCHVIPSAPAKSGYTFLGWYDADNVLLTDKTRMPANDVTFTAVYEAVTAE